MASKRLKIPREGEGTPLQGLSGACDPTGCGFQDFFCHERGNYFTHFCLKGQCPKQDKHICLFIRIWPQAEFLQVLP